MNFLIISSISVKQLNIMEVHHDQDALLNFVWKCLLTVIYSSCKYAYLRKPSQARIIITIIIIIHVIIIINNLIAPFLQASKGALQLFTLVKTI